MKLIKNNGARGVPQVSPGIHLSSVRMVSYITLGQSSPVLSLMHMTRAMPKLEKFMLSLIWSPTVISLNMKTARTAKIK